MTTTPQIRRRVFLAGDAFTDWLCKPWANRVPDKVLDPLFVLEERAQKLACRLWGHTPIADQCGIPAHDYCALCHASTPAQADRRHG